MEVRIGRNSSLIDVEDISCAAVSFAYENPKIKNYT